MNPRKALPKPRHQYFFQLAKRKDVNVVLLICLEATRSLDQMAQKKMAASRIKKDWQLLRDPPPMSLFALFVVPKTYWSTGKPAEPGTLRPLLQEVVTLRRRMSKGANLEAERSRYTICITELEARPEFRVHAKERVAETAVAALNSTPLDQPTHFVLAVNQQTQEAHSSTNKSIASGQD